MRLRLGLGLEREEALTEAGSADAHAATEVRWMFLTPHLLDELGLGLGENEIKTQAFWRII